MPLTTERRPLLIMTLGGALRGDDGLATAAVARLEREYAVPAEVEVLAAGTPGPALLPRVLRAEAVILVDAVRTDAGPGSLVRLTGDELDSVVDLRPSAGRLQVTELLDGLRWAGCGPLHLSLLGLVPRSLDSGAPRSPEVEAALPALVTALAEEAHRLGYALDRRQADTTHGAMARRAATA
jgi:hydrogenase maturation protease